MKVTTVYMPGMFSTKADAPSPSRGYEPMSYVLGEPCERCWLTVAGKSYGNTSWVDHDAAIRPVGGFGCPHGGAS